MSEFHFLRPHALLLLLPMLALLVALWRRHHQQQAWQQWISASLLRPLLSGAESSSRAPLLVLGLGWLLASLALAGPTWQRLPQPLYQPQSALVILLDLSPSMNAEDLRPSRLVQARLRLIDLLRERREGQTALIVYAGDAHVVTPLSQDRNTLLALVPSLSPAIMPVRGSRVEAAVEEALKLFQRSGQNEGQLLLITDGVTAEAAAGVRERLAGRPYPLSILGVGTAEGAPIPLGDGRFASDHDGNTVLARLNSEPLARLAADSGGIYRTLTPLGRELADFVTQFRPSRQDGDPTRRLEQTFDQWQEAGPWLLLALLPLAALGFRRGWLLAVPLVVSLPLSAPQSALAAVSPVADDSQAASDPGWWQQLWYTKDQLARQRFERQAYDAAAGLFQEPGWQGSAHYRAGNYAEAVEAYRRALDANPDADTHYNLGNALARSGQLESALEAYDEALKRQPKNEDARANRALVEDLLKRQQEQEQQEQQQEQEQEQEQNRQDRQGQDKSGNGSGGSGDSGDQPPSHSEPEPEEDRNKDRNKETEGAADESTRPDEPPADAPRAQPQPPESGAAQPELEASDGRDSGANTAPRGKPSDSEELERWLRQLPEDPGGLLRRKFEYQYRQKLKAYREGRWTPPEETRW